MVIKASGKNRILGLAPVISADAHTLILGSIPGEESLRWQQYYANPRNAFWRIIAGLGGNKRGVSYEKYLEMLGYHHLAVWDVVHSCHRVGSLDSAIQKSSVQANDLNDFFTRNPKIRRVFFNGTFAEQSYQKHVLPDLSKAHAGIPILRLPSTSPAYAGLSFIDKTHAWRVILD